MNHLSLKFSIHISLILTKTISPMRILSFILIFFVISAFVNHQEHKTYKDGLQETLRRIVSARIYNNKLWTLGDHDANYAADVLSQLNPTYISGLIHLDASNKLTDKQIQSFKIIQKKVKSVNPDCKFDFPINPNHYKTPEDILTKLKEINATLNIDIWYLDFYQSEFRKSSKVIEAVIEFAHQNQQWVGGNELDKSLLKKGDFVAFTDASTVNLDLKAEIIRIGKQYNIPIVFQINNDTNISNDDTVHTYIKKWKTYERERHVRRLAKNQASWKYKLMYPVFFPVFLKHTAYDAAQDGEILAKYQSIMNLYNELE